MIAALQETKLTPSSKISTANHSLVRRDREKCGIDGGIAFLINYITSTNTPHIDQQEVTTTPGSTQIRLVNVYIPPTKSSPSGSSTSEDSMTKSAHQTSEF